MSLLNLYPNRGLTFVRGEGPHLYTRDGARYLDCGAGYGSNLLGHAHPGVTAALRAQAEALTILHGSFSNDIRLRATVALAARLPMNAPALCWCNSGTEAIEAALKFAVLISGRKRFVVCEGAYHGKTLGALSATAGESYRAPFEPLLWDFVRVPYGNAAAVRAALDDRTAAVLLEPIQGESGIIVPSDGYLAAVRAACDERGALLIADEIQTGCGRTGSFTVCEADNVRPDILCLGKGLAGGIPVGVTAVAGAHATAITRGSHTSTFGGNPLAAAGTLATLAAIDGDVLRNVENRGEQLRAGLHDAAEVRGRGVMIGARVAGDRDAVLKRMQASHVIAIPAGKDVVRFLPPLVASETDVDEALAAFRAAIRAA